MSDLYIFWDNSNIHYSGLNNVFPIKEPGIDRYLYRTHFMNLLKMVESGRTIKQVYFVGSTPPEKDDVWAYLRSIGINPQTIPRAENGKEWETTDHLLQTHLLRLGYDSAPQTIAMLSGDGKGFENGEGFFADLKRLAQNGWQVEVYSWDI